MHTNFTGTGAVGRCSAAARSAGIDERRVCRLSFKLFFTCTLKFFILFRLFLFFYELFNGQSSQRAAAAVFAIKAISAKRSLEARRWRERRAPPREREASERAQKSLAVTAADDLYSSGRALAREMPLIVRRCRRRVRAGRRQCRKATSRRRCLMRTLESPLPHRRRCRRDRR